MTHHSRKPQIWRLLCGLLVLTVAFTACGSDDETTDNATEEEAAEESDPHPQAANYVPKDYADIYDEDDTAWFEVGAIEDTSKALQSCGANSADFRLGDPGEIIFGFSPAFRFHPADDPGDDPGGRAALVNGRGSPSDMREVYVVDRGDHGAFITELIHAQLGIQPGQEQVGAAGQVVTDKMLADALAEVPIGSVVNLSLGTYVCEESEFMNSDTMTEIFNHLSGGTTFVVSAGNSEFEQESWPAALSRSEPQVHSVGATEDFDATIRSCYSNFGDWVSAWARGDELETEGALAASSPIAPWSGTSFAAPLVLAEVMIAGGPANPSTTTPPQPKNSKAGNNAGVMTFCDSSYGFIPGFN